MSHRYAPRPSLTTNSSPGPLRWLPRIPPGNTCSARLRRSVWSLIVEPPSKPLSDHTREPSPVKSRRPAGGSLHSRPREELPGTGEVRRIDHLALEGERVDAALRVVVEQRDELARLVDRRLQRR